MFGGSLLVTTVPKTKGPTLVLIRPKAVAAEPAGSAGAPDVQTLTDPVQTSKPVARALRRETEKASGPKLEAAPIIVSGGRGAGGDPGGPRAQGQVSAAPTLPKGGREKQLSLLAVEPHPDDESIGMGGTLARYSAEGVRTTLVTATRGEVGEILDKDLDPKEAAPRLATIREPELRNAPKILGVNELVFLGYQDSGMAGLPRNRERGTFWQADEEEAIERLIQVVRRVRPQVMVTQNEFGGYAHPDHIKTLRVAIGAFFYAGDVKRFPGGEPYRPSKLYYSAFPKSLMRQMAEAMERAGVENRFSTDGEPPPFAVSDDRVTTWLDVSQFVDKKLAAMRAHRTQIPEDSWFLRLNEALGPKAWGMETFERVRSSVEAPIPEDDLFAGLR